MLVGGESCQPASELHYRTRNVRQGLDDSVEGHAYACDDICQLDGKSADTDDFVDCPQFEVLCDGKC